MSGELMGKSIRELAPLIEQRQISPVDVMKECLANIEQMNAKLNIFITVLDGDLLLSQARDAESEISRGAYKGPLHGIPYSAKDNINTRNIRTTAGSKVLGVHVPAADATVIRKLRQAGAILVGKNNLHEFAMGGTGANVHFGDSKNPYNPELVTGGSSGGSASAVATQCSVFSLGTDTGGSVRLPAAYCGVVGWKPTYGAISLDGVIPLNYTQDHVGILSQTAWDSAWVMQAIAGYDATDPESLKSGPIVEMKSWHDPKWLQGRSIGYLSDYPIAIDSEVRGAIDRSLRVFEELGASLVEVSLPWLPEIVPLWGTILKADSYAYHKPFIESRPEGYGPVIDVILEGRSITVDQYIEAQRKRRIYQKKWEALFDRIDMLAIPTAAFPAFPIGAKFVEINGVKAYPTDMFDPHAALRRAANLNGYPAISVPCGLTGAGLPIGLQLMGRPLEDELVLQTAHLYEWHSNWKKGM
jgi:aspartyl-tRNA(Asn)/glutamyl-tRNA(Gln) amidotransferase subunit A